MMITVGVGVGGGDDPFTAVGLDVINEMLQQAGLPAHRVPASVPDDAQWPNLDEIPHSYFDRLRRVQAWVNQGRGLPPVLPEGADVAADPIIHEEIAMLDSHVVLHFSEGWYVPVYFDEPMLDERLPGSGLGSSQRLLEELRCSGDALGVPHEGELIPEPVIEQIAREEERGDPYGAEKLIWFALYDAARRSVRYDAVVYHGG